MTNADHRSGSAGPRVLVGGATGAIGLPLVRQLVAAGYHVLALTRHRERAGELEALGATPVIADALDREGLLRAVDGMTADAVIHQLTSIQGPPLSHRVLRPTNRLRIEGSANLIAAARVLGARRYVTQSFFGGYGFTDHGAAPLTEDAPFGVPAGRASDEILAALRSTEEQAFNAKDLEGIALRYGSFYGPDSVRMTAQALREGMLKLPRNAGGVWPFIHVEDAARATVAALGKGRPGSAYNVADDEPMRYVEFVQELAKAVGAPGPKLVPGWRLLPFPFMREMLGTTIRLANVKARTHLDWTPLYPSCRDGLAAAARALNASPATPP